MDHSGLQVEQHCPGDVVFVVGLDGDRGKEERIEGGG